MDEGLPDYNFGTTPRNGQFVFTDNDGDESLDVRFYRNPMDDLDHIEIRFPGDKTQINDEIVDENWKFRFPKHWEAYQGGGAYEGQTRIETMPWVDYAVTKKMHEEYRIFTVEQLAAMPNDRVMAIPGMLALQQKAQKHMAEREKLSVAETLAEQNAMLMKRLEALEAQLGEVAGEPKRRGRPPKVQNAPA